MSGFLQRLFQYRATEGRTPLEDFLSEVLADLIERMPRADAEAFVLQCFVPDALWGPARLLMQGQRIDARTQVRLPDGRRLDLLLEIAGQPFIVVENKIRAAFQMHARPARAAMAVPQGGAVDPPPEDGWEPPAVERDHQLATYGRWLAEAPKPAGWPGVIALLSHAARAPGDFVSGDVERYGAVPHLSRWRGLHGCLRRLVGIGPYDPEMPAWTFLGREFCAFLEHNGMDSSDMNPVDIASINVASGPLRKIEAVYAEIGAELLQQHPGDLVRKGQGYEFKPEHSRFWGWTYVAGPGQLYVGYGVFFAPTAGEFATTSPPLPDQEHAFVAFGCDERTLDPGPSGFPQGWVQVGDGWYVVKAFPLSDRRSEERFPQFITRLVQGVFPTILAMRQGQLGQAGAPEA